MERKRIRFVLVFAVAAALLGQSSLPSRAAPPQREGASTNGTHPTFFKVYSRDGRESLTATCNPIGTSAVVRHISCEFMNVRFDQLPPRKTMPVSVDEYVTLAAEDFSAANPHAAQQVEKDLKGLDQETKNRLEQEFRTQLEKLKQEFCEPSSEARGAMEAKMRDPVIGPKRKAYLRNVLDACSDQDPTILFRRLPDLERRSCNLWVDRFTLEFTRVKDGQWLYRQETPGLLSKVLKIYELTGEGLLWTLTETRVPTQGSGEIPQRTEWSWKNLSDYELPCEFISH